MCGLVGMVSKRSSGFLMPQMEFFTQGLTCDSVRGTDATGVFFIDKKNKGEVLKQAVPAGIFVETDAYSKWKDRAYQSARIMVGHNRWKTVGENSSKNAHPFVEKPIILVHNGNIRDHKNHDANVEVDSHAAAVVLSKNEDVEALKKLDGAIAFIWYNLQTKTLNFFRNSQRPLHIAEDNDGLYFASEEGMLSWLLKRNKINYDKLKEVPTETLFRINLNEIKLSYVSVNRNIIPYQGTGYHGYGYGDDGLNDELRYRRGGGHYNSHVSTIEKDFDMAKYLRIRERNANYKKEEDKTPPKKSPEGKKPDKENSSDELDVKLGAFINFEPKTVSPNNFNRYKLYGRYKVKDHTYDVYCWFPSSLEGSVAREHYLRPASLTGKIISISLDPKRANRVLYVDFDSLTRTEMIKDATGKEYSTAVWKYLEHNTDCYSCSKPLSIKTREYCLVDDSDGEYRFKCPLCCSTFEDPVVH